MLYQKEFRPSSAKQCYEGDCCPIAESLGCRLMVGSVTRDWFSLDMTNCYCAGYCKIKGFRDFSLISSETKDLLLFKLYEHTSSLKSPNFHL